MFVMLVLAIVACAASAPVAALAPPATTTPRVRPMQDRDSRKILVPRDLRLEIKGDRAGLSIDDRTLETIDIVVGRHLTTGFKFMRGGSIGYTSGDRADGGTSYMPLAPGTTIEMTIVFFETDVVPQHMWHPESGRYRELWTRTLRVTMP